MSDFQNTRPLPFASADEPMDAEEWLRDIKRKLNVVDCNDEEKLRYTSYLLTGPTASWWEAILAIKPPGSVITWAELKERFRNTHVPHSIMELKRSEFESVRQNDSPILQYVREFSELSLYAPDEVDTEEKRVKRFMKGLNLYMRMQLPLTGHHNFQGIVDVAITLEDDYKSVQEEQRKKARTEPKCFPNQKPTPNLTFKPKPRPGNPNPNPNRGGQNPKNNMICHNCGVKGHYKSECRQPKVICYGCG
jgi:hypothetical protein